MNRRFEAKIVWLSEVQGGRKEIPFSDRYAPIIEITKPPCNTIDFWSAFVMNKERLSDNETLAYVEYLSDVAPDNISIGVEFSLYEGSKNVASGVVLREVSDRIIH